MKRWLFRIALVIVILLLILAGVVQIILWTDLPRRRLLDTLSTQLGMELKASSFSTGWTGSTTIENLELTLPLEQQAFLAIPETHLSHSSLPWILLTQSVVLDSIQIRHPALNLRQEQSGHWNAQDVASLIGGISRANTERSSDLTLPDLQMTDGSITITDRMGNVTQIGPLGLHGKPKGRLAWRFAMDVPDQIHLQGEVSSSVIHAHKMDIKVERGEEFLKTWMTSENVPLHLTGQWHGRFNNGQLTGKLQLEALEFGKTKIKGGLSVMVGAEGIRVEPEDLIFHNPTFPIQEAEITSGSLQLCAETFQADHLTIERQGHVVIIDGNWDWSAEKGICNGTWAGSFSEQAIRHQGTWQGTINSPRTGRKQIQVQFHTQGRTPWGNWQTQVEISGSGSSWLASQWRTTVPHFLWRREGREMQLDTITARWITDWPRIQLDSLCIANASEVTARGDFSAENRHWSLELATENVSLGQGYEPIVNFKLEAKGDSSGVDCSAFELRHQGLKIAGLGKLALPSKELREAHVSVSGKAHFDDQNTKESESLTGNWQLETDITGNIYPFKTELCGHLMAENVAIGKKQIPSITIPLSGTLDPKALAFQTKPFTLFDGLWQLDGRYDFDNHSGQAELNVRDLSLRTTAELVDSPLCWQGDMSAELKVKLPERDLGRMTASGSWRAKDLKMPPFEAEQAQGQLNVSNGIVAFERIHLQQKGGKAQAEMRFRLDKPHLLDIEAKAQAWPLEMKDYDLHLRTDGQTKLQLNALKRTANGKGDLSVETQLNGKDFGRFTLDAEVQERILALDNIQMQTIGGQIEGKATISLDHWPQSTSELRWQNIDLAMLGDRWPRLKGLTGRSSGVLTAMPTEEQRPLGPLYLQSKVDLSDAMLHGAQLGHCEVEAYAGQKRLLIKQAMLEVAGGVIRSRTNFSRHNEELFTHINSDFERLDLDQILHIFQPQANKVAGYLTGKGSIVFFRDLKRLTGTADFQLSETDLVNNYIISTLYNSLNLKFDQAQPEGIGRISLRAEGSTLQIPSFYYFNRGVEVRGASAIKDLNLGLASPIEGYVIGSTRPLKNIHVPGVEELDKLMTSLQKSVASVRIEGTLGKPDVKIVSFPEISSAVRRLLWGQLRE